jgi:hypothetical protein
VRPLAESRPGNLGMSLQANPELGVAIVETFWASHEALRVSDRVVAPARSETVRRARGTLTVERCRLPVFEQEGRLGGAEGVRLTRTECRAVQGGGRHRVVRGHRRPMAGGIRRFRSARPFADPTSGHLISEDVWEDPHAPAGSRGAAAVGRVDAAAATDCAIRAIRAVEEYVQVFSSVRKP